MTNDPLTHMRITARENQILDAAVAVFAEKGFHATTVHEIAQRAGVADGTIYTYFDSKTDLLLGIFERMRTAVVLDALPAPPGEGDPRALLATALGHALSALRPDDFALFRIVVSEMMVNAELRERYAETILEPTLLLAETAVGEAAVALGRDVAPEDIRLAVRTVSATVMGLMLAYVIGDETVRAAWERLPDYLAGLILTTLHLDERNEP